MIKSKFLEPNIDLRGVPTAPTNGNAATSTTQIATTAFVQAVRALLIPSSEKAAALGVATLDASGKLATSQIPDSLVGGLVYQGAWDASTGSFPTVGGMADKGKFWVISVAGTLNPGSHAVAVGDWIVWDGSTWDIIDHAQTVTSVNGLVGAVVLNSDDVAEGLANLYFTAARAKTAAVANTINSGILDVAPSQDAVYQALATKAADSVVVKTVNGVGPSAGAVTINSDNVAEGSANHYFTAARAKSAAVANSISSGVTDMAPSEDAVYQALALKLNASEKGSANGVATLDAGGKVPASMLPNSVMEFKGAWNASTNSPTLVDGTGNAGDVYRVSAPGTQNLGSGALSFTAGDWVMYSGTIWEKSPGTDAVTSVNGKTGVVLINSDDVNEGTSNLYFTNARAQSAAVENAINSGTTSKAPSEDAVFNALAGKLPSSYLDTDPALTANSDAKVPSQKAVKAYVTGLAPQVDGVTIKVNGSSKLEGYKPKKKSVTLNATDISNGYVDLADVAAVDSVDFFIDGIGYVGEGIDFSVSYTGGASSKTRVTFMGELVSGGGSPLASGDAIIIKYQYL